MNELPYKEYLKMYAKLLKTFLMNRFPMYDWTTVITMAENMYQYEGIDRWQWDYVFLACDNYEGEDMEIASPEQFIKEENECDPSDRRSITESWYCQLYELYESFRANQSIEEIALVSEMISAMPKIIELGFDWRDSNKEKMVEFIKKLEINCEE